MFNTVEEIKAAKTAELVAFWNAKSDKPVKKFADRATAEKRCISLLAALEALAEDHSNKASEAWEDLNVRPVVHAPRQVTVKPEVEEESTEELSDEEFEAKMKAEIAGGVEKKEARSNSAGIAASWTDKKVFEARMKRDGVSVEWNGVGGLHLEEFKSVRAAFAALALPDSKHIRFRMKLKESKVAVFPWAGVDYTFKIV